MPPHRLPLRRQSLSWNEKGQTLPAVSEPRQSRSGLPARLYPDPTPQVEVPSNAASLEVERRLTEAYQRGLRESTARTTEPNSSEAYVPIHRL